MERAGHARAAAAEHHNHLGSASAGLETSVCMAPEECVRQYIKPKNSTSELVDALINGIRSGAIAVHPLPSGYRFLLCWRSCVVQSAEITVKKRGEPFQTSNSALPGNFKEASISLLSRSEGKGINKTTLSILKTRKQEYMDCASLPIKFGGSIGVYPFQVSEWDFGILLLSLDEQTARFILAVLDSVSTAPSSAAAAAAAAAADSQVGHSSSQQTALHRSSSGDSRRHSPSDDDQATHHSPSLLRGGGSWLEFAEGPYEPRRLASMSPQRTPTDLEAQHTPRSPAARSPPVNSTATATEPHPHEMPELSSEYLQQLGLLPPVDYDINAVLAECDAEWAAESDRRGTKRRQDDFTDSDAKRVADQWSAGAISEDEFLYDDEVMHTVNENSDDELMQSVHEELDYDCMQL